MMNMLHRPPRRRRPPGPLAALLVLGGFASALLLAATPARAQVEKDRIVPEDALAVEIATFHEEHTLAFDRTGHLRHLKRYVLPDRTARNETDGTISRTVTDVNLNLTYGISDTWNLFVGLPYRILEQDSSLSTSSDRASTNTQVERLQSQKLSGLGDLRVTSLFRPVFSDRNGFVWGYGFTHPLQDRSESDPGLQALALRSPNPTMNIFWHYTRYPQVERTRIDLRFEYEAGLPGRYEKDDGNMAQFRSGNAVTLELGWYQEIADVAYGVAWEEFVQAQSRSSGIGNSDPHKESQLHFRLGYGNLTELENGPLTVPYQVMLTVDRSLRGFNVPYSDGYTLSLLFYF